MKYSLNEDLFDDIVEIEVPEAEAPVVLDTPQRGPETPQEVGESSLLLDAIAATAQNIDNYNVIKVNMTDSDMVKVMEDIADMENYKLGKLQSLLKMVSPNAESIMNGAVEAEEQAAQDTPDIQLESLKEDWKDGELTKQEFSDWDWEMINTAYRIERSIKTMLRKYPEYRDEILSTAKNCRNIFNSLCSFYNESLDESNDMDIEKVSDKLDSIIDAAKDAKDKFDNGTKNDLSLESCLGSLRSIERNLDTLKKLVNGFHDEAIKTRNKEFGESLNEDLRKEIFDYLDECGGYTDYNQKIEDVADEFNLSEEEASNYVWDWSIQIEEDFDEDDWEPCLQPADADKDEPYDDEFDESLDVEIEINTDEDEDEEIDDEFGTDANGWEHW